MNTKHNHGIHKLCLVCFILIAKVQTESPDNSWASLLDKLCRTLHLQRMVFLSSHIHGGGGGFNLAKTSIHDGSRTVRFVGQDYQVDLDLLESRESLVVDTAGIDVDKLFQLLNDNTDSVGILSPAILVLNSKVDVDQLKFPDFKINQMVYFLVLEEGIIFEKYSINEQTINRDLYEYNNKSGLFESMAGATSDFVLRRSNLQGVHLKVFVGHQPPYLSIGDRPKDKEFERHTTVEGVQAERIYPEQMEGIFRNLQIMMENELNFTATYYRRLDRKWGDMHPNGSFYGMINDVHQGHIDLISASVTIKHSRAKGVKYLHPIGTETYALFIPTTGREEFAWQVFLYPFSNEVWILLALYGLLGALVIRLIYCTCHTMKGGRCAPLHSRILESISVTWSVFCSYLGGKPPECFCNHEIPTPLKMAVFATFFFGTVVWAAYRASLTSELVDTVDKEPFDSLETFLNSDYQMIARIGGASEHILKTSPEESIFNRLYVKNLKDEEQAEEYFMKDVAPALAKLWESDVKTAYYYVIETVLTFKQYECKLVTPWVSRYPKFLSMATPPRSPYFPFMQRFVLRHIEKGTVSVLNMRWKRQFPECGGQDGQALTMEKTVSLFFVWAAGAMMAVAILFAEVVGRLAQKRGISAFQEQEQLKQERQEQLRSFC